jgi:hypothetical protein
MGMNRQVKPEEDDDLAARVPSETLADSSEASTETKAL